MKKALAVLVSVVTGSAAGSGAARAGSESLHLDDTASQLLDLLDDVLPPDSPTPADGGLARPRIPRVARRAIDELGDQIAAASDAGVIGLPSAERRCALGILYAHSGDLSRAQLHLGACVQPDVGGQLRERGGQTRAALARALRKSELSPVDIDTGPTGWLVSVEGFAQGTFVTPHTLWLPTGKHRFHFAPTAAALRTGGAEVIARELTITPHSRSSLFVNAPAPARAAAPGIGKVSFEEEVALEPPQTAPPPPEKHRSMLPDRYRKGLSVAMPEEQATTRRAALSLQLGAGRQAPTDARADATTTRLAAHGRVAFAPRWFVELGVDWTHRFDGGGGGEPMAGAPEPAEASANAFGALLGARVVLWQPAELSLLAALRGRLEAGDTARGGGALQLEARPIAGWPIAVGGAVELERGQRTYSAFAAVELWTN